MKTTPFFEGGGPGMRNSDDCDQSFQRIATSVTRVRDGAVG
jgi:hypothetical protein